MRSVDEGSTILYTVSVTILDGLLITDTRVRYEVCCLQTRLARQQLRVLTTTVMAITRCWKTVRLNVHSYGAE